MDLPRRLTGRHVIATLAAVVAAMAAFPAVGGADLTQVASVDGTIADATPSRVLYIPKGTTGAAILSVATGKTTTVPIPDGRYMRLASRLFAGGALIAWYNGASSTTEISEFRDGELSRLGHLDSLDSIEVAGNYAIWNDGATLYRRDFAAQTTQVVADDAADNDNDVTDDGDVVYWTTANTVRRWHDGASVQLSQQPDYVKVRRPLTDGTNVVYSIERPCCPGPCCSTNYVAFSDGVHETVLDSLQYRADPLTDYVAANGWLAYT